MKVIIFQKDEKMFIKYNDQIREMEIRQSEPDGYDTSLVDPATNSTLMRIKGQQMELDFTSLSN